MLGSRTSARAKPARLRMPPESSLGILSCAAPRPTSSRRLWTISRISSSDLSVCWRSGKATLSTRFIEPNRAPSWNSTPNRLRMSNSSSSVMFGTDSPWTRTSPSSGYSRPTMCLMHTDFPVPEGPRIMEILPSGRPMFRPHRILLRPKALWTSTNSTASGTPVGRLSPVCHWYSSSPPSWPPVGGASRTTASRSSSGLRGTASRSVVVSFSSDIATSASDRSPWVRSPEHLCSQHPDQMHQNDVHDHRFCGGGTDADGSSARVIAVVAPDKDDGRGHHHALDHAVEQVGRVLEHPEDEREAA